MGKTYREELVGVFGCPIDENPTKSYSRCCKSSV